jgi:hypothetical protein
LFFVCLVLSGLTGFSQRAKADAGVAKLPVADKIVADYLKAIGGKRRVSAVRDATYGWGVKKGETIVGTAVTHSKAPSSYTMAATVEDLEVRSGVSSGSVWEKGRDGTTRTLTDKRGNDARLRALLLASRFLDYKKANVQAKVTSSESLDGDTQYVIEFSMKNGARVRAWFSASKKVLIRMADDSGYFQFGDYRNESELLEPHQLETEVAGAGRLTLVLQRVAYNRGLTHAEFDPPRGPEAIDVASLLREVQKNQEKVDERVSEYYFLQKETEREINDKGELKRETIKTYEVFPVPGRESVLKLVSENGVPLTGERSEKEQKRVGEELARADKERQKDKEKREKKAAERDRKNDDNDPGITAFLRVCELVSPRHEQLGNRNAVVFDFRAKPGFKPSNREESIVSKLIGSVWIDPVDKEVIRLEARFAEGYKIGGGLVLSLRPGAAFAIEQTRLDEGVWLPKFAQANLSYKLLLFGGGNVNKTLEWSDYRRFKSEATDYTLESPKTDTKGETKPDTKPQQ